MMRRTALTWTKKVVLQGRKEKNKMDVLLKTNWVDSLDHLPSPAVPAAAHVSDEKQPVPQPDLLKPAAQLGEKIRKLATIVKIDEVTDHSNADLLAVAKVKGWQVVTHKERDGYKAGDLAVYLEIDSVVPEDVVAGRAEHAILEKKKFTVKTAKIRGELSQGILFRLDILPEGEFKEGEDVTELLRITKFEPKLPSEKVIKRFPATIPKTDEERVQNIPCAVLDTMIASKMKFYVTEKVDGASITVYLMNGEFGVASRNWVVTEDTTHGETAIKMKLETRMRNAGLDNIALQGELVGPSIQANRYKLPSLTIRFFSVFSLETKKYLSYSPAKSLVDSLRLEWVPVIHESFTLTESDIPSLLLKAEGPSVLHKSTQREGLVFRACEETDHPTLGRVSFKAISNKYLLKYES
eukprot:TRINITY_DN6256_c0_g2_i1.p1 TRINITY_DN6256_c0_g2~~TRINITY_DN6256_c0_g2_i1.p1  ORF type:complete len:410 (+),score=80.88 TRINITY_DN6256_c0_g2_i1:68-1297(+)